MSLEKSEQAGTLLSEAYDLARRIDPYGKTGLSEALGVRKLGGDFDETDFLIGYLDVYLAARSGVPHGPAYLPATVDSHARQLTLVERMQAYHNGLNDAKARVKANKRAANFATVAGTEKGLVYDEYVKNELAKEIADRINELAKRLNFRVKFVDSIDGGIADGKLDGADILIAKDTQNPEMVVLGHEVGHWLEKTAPEEYQALRQFVSQHSQAEISDRMAAYEAMGKEMDYDAVAREFVNDDIGRMIADPEVLDRFINENRENRTLLQRFADALRALWQKLTGKERQQVKTAEDALLAALHASEKQAAALEKAGQTMDFATETARTGAEYQIKTLPDGKKYVQADRQVIFGNDPEGWSRQLEDYINGKIRKGENVRLTAADGDVLTLTADTAGKVSSPFEGDGTRLSAAEFERKVDAGAHIDELAEVSTSAKKGATDEGGVHGDFAKHGWNYRTAFFRDFDGGYYRVTISAAMNDSGTIVYNIGKMRKRDFPNYTGSSARGGAQSVEEVSLGSRPTVNGSSAKSGAQGGEKASLEDSIPQSGGKVNPETGIFQTAEQGDKTEGIDSDRPDKNESDIADSARRMIKTIAGKGKTVGFAALPKEIQQPFLDGLENATPEVKEILGKHYRSADYMIGAKKWAYHSGGFLGGTIYIGPHSVPSTLAHELFHEIDGGHKISMALGESLLQDHISLDVKSGVNIRGYLLQQYPAAFSRMSKEGVPMMGEAYRGIADILNGLSGGKEKYGFRHSAEYWAKPGNLEAEAWAQFGRILYENKSDVLEMFKKVFPNFYKAAIIALKGVM